MLMSGVYKHLSVVCLAALAGPVLNGQAASAENGRGAAPIVFANASPAPAVSRRAVGGPVDIRVGAQRASFHAGANPTTAAPSGATPAPEGWSRPYAGPPYQVKGKWFVPMHEPDYDEVGIASWYGPGFDGELASAGETFDQDALTAAHPTLPIPSVVRVTNLENNRSVLLRLNDRGPYVDDRIIDLSRGAADVLDVRKNGTAKVRVQYVGPAPVDPNVELTERMFAGVQTLNDPAQPTNDDTVWSTPLPAASGMPERPVSQASADGYDRPEEPTPTAALLPMQPTAGGYALQVGSFSDLSNAHRALASFKNDGAGFVTAAVVNGGQFYRVMLGPWPEKRDAEGKRAALAEIGKSAIVVNVDS